MATAMKSHFTARTFARPRILLSKCLELDACRYDGAKIGDPFIRRLLDFVDVVPVCPEVEIGLGVPRDTIRLVDTGAGTTLRQPSTEADLTSKMERFAHRFIDALGPVDGLILKSASPSCGPAGIKVYSGLSRAPALRKESGLFARALIERRPHTPLEDEGRLRNYPIRDHFLTRLYATAQLREILAAPTMKKLVAFQSRYKHVLMTAGQESARELGRLVANSEELPTDEVATRYAEKFADALVEPPSRKAHINTLQHMYGHFKKMLTDAERHEFLAILEEVREHQVARVSAMSIIRTWSARFQYDYFADEAYLEPYPRELLLMRDSGKGHDF